MKDRANGHSKPDRWTVYMHIFPNGKRYIGITSRNPAYRWVEGGKGYKEQGLIWNAIQKYGWENVEHSIIKESCTKEEAEYYEQFYITLYQSDNRKHGYNIRPGGSTSRGYKLREETKQKMSVSRKGEKNWNYGKHLSEETKKKLSIAHKGKCNIEALRRGAKKRAGENAYNARSVDCFSADGKYIKTFKSLADGARETGIRVQDIYACCTGKQKTSHGTRWVYTDIRQVVSA